MEKTYCQFPVSGSSWSSFAEPEEDEESEVENNNGSEQRHATRFRRKEMQLFGHYPAQDNFSLVTCKECGKILKTSVFTRHCENFHKKLLSALNASLSSPDVKRTKLRVFQPKVIINKLETIDVNDNMDVDTADVKIEEVPVVVPKLNHVVVSEPIINRNDQPSNSSDQTSNSVKRSTGNSSKKVGKDSPRKSVLTKDREYDPNRHCGVWVQEMNKNCTRSLTCKTHALSLRRAVPGRRKQFDVLLNEHRERVNLAKEQHQLSCKAHSLTSGDVGTGNKLSDQRNAFSNLGFNGGGQVNKDVSSSLAYKSQHSNLEEDEADLPYLNHHPKPMASCKFGARRAGKRCYIFNRKSDHLRTTVLSMVDKLLHPSQPSQTTGKHSVHRRYNIKTAGQSSSQGSNSKTDIPGRARVVVGGSTLTSNSGSTVFRNSTKPKITRQTSVERNVHVSSRTAKHIITTNTLVQTTSANQRLTSIKVKPDSSDLTSGNNGSFTSDACVSQVTQTIGTRELESSLNLCKDLGIVDTSVGSSISTVILNGPIASGDLLTNHVQNSGLAVANSGSVVKNIAPAPSPRTSYIVPVTHSSSGPTVYHKNSQAVSQHDGSSGTSVMSSPTVFQRQSSNGSPQMSPLVNGTAPSPPPNINVKAYPCNIVGKTAHLNTKGISSNAGVTHSVTNFSQGQTLVFANTNISQLQAQQLAQPVVTHISQGL